MKSFTEVKTSDATAVYGRHSKCIDRYILHIFPLIVKRQKTMRSRTVSSARLLKSPGTAGQFHSRDRPNNAFNSVNAAFRPVVRLFPRRNSASPGSRILCRYTNG